MSFKEQIMSKDKYQSIFSPQIESIFIRSTRSVENWGIFGRMWCLDQSRMSEKVSFDGLYN